jgi:hypothetical protein
MFKAIACSSIVDPWASVSYLDSLVVLSSVVYSLCPKTNVILEILGQIIKEVKWPQLPLFICHIKC